MGVLSAYLPLESASTLSSQGESRAFRILAILFSMCIQLHLGVVTNTYYHTAFKSQTEWRWEQKILAKVECEIISRFQWCVFSLLFVCFGFGFCCALLLLVQNCVQLRLVRGDKTLTIKILIFYCQANTKTLSQFWNNSFLSSLVLISLLWRPVSTPSCSQVDFGDICAHPQCPFTSCPYHVLHQTPAICNLEATEFLFSHFPLVKNKSSPLPKDKDIKLSPMLSIRDTTRAL